MIRSVGSEDFSWILLFLKIEAVRSADLLWLDVKLLKGISELLHRMPEDGGPDGLGTRGRPANADNGVDERTSLLAALNFTSYDGDTPSTCETAEDDEFDETDIDPNEFDRLLSRSESISTGIGIEPQSQETAMLRGPRRYSNLRKSCSRGTSQVRTRRKSFASTVGSTSEVIDEEEAVAEETEPKSPFLAGVSVSQFWLVFGGVLATNFVSCFDSTIMVSSHPVITSYFHSSNSASWLSTAFLLTSTSFQPLFGRLSDTIGRKGPYLFTMTIFLIATIWCALAQSMTSFIIARAVCGLGAGGMMTMGSIITSDLVPIEIRGAYQSYINIIFGLGSSAGAALGGAVADSLGWRWEFGIQVPALAFCILISAYTVPSTLGLSQGAQQKSVMEAMKVFDFKGSILLTTSITFLILGLVSVQSPPFASSQPIANIFKNLGGNVLPWSHPFIIASLVIFTITFPLFLHTESKVPLPIMPLAIINSNPRAGLIFANAIGAVITNAVLFNIPLYFQAVLLTSATSSGLRLIIPTIAASAVGTLTGFLITWTRRLYWLLVLGVIFLTFGTTILCFMPRTYPSWAYLLFLIPSFIGQGFMFPATFMSVLAVSPQEEQAVVSSTLILWRSMGIVLGVAASSLVVQNALVLYLDQKVIGPEKERVSFPPIFPLSPLSSKPTF